MTHSNVLLQHVWDQHVSPRQNGETLSPFCLFGKSDFFFRKMKYLILFLIVSAAWLISWDNQRRQTSPTKDSFSPSPVSPVSFPLQGSCPLQGSPPDDLSSFFSESQGVQFRVQPSNPFAIRGIERNDLSVSFEVRTGKIDQDAPRRDPLNLAIVLDKSGSMFGDKIQNSIRAILEALDRLDERDRVHLVAYGSSSDIVFEGRNPIQDSSLLKRLVSNIFPGGSTNLWGGMEKAAKLLKEYSQEGYQNRVMLFSDGHVNFGETNSQVIISSVGRVFCEGLNAKVSSFGIGLGFNEDLMKEIASIGQGMYFFIENSDTIPQFVEFSLGVVAQPLLYNVKLRIVGINGAVVGEIFGHKNISLGAHLGDIEADNVRTVISSLNFSLPGEQKGEQSDDSPSIFDFVRFELEFRLRGETKPRVLEGKLAIQGTNDARVVSENQNDRVVSERMVAETSKMDLEIKEALERGENEKAIEIQNKEIEELQKAAELDVEGTANSNSFLASAIEMLAQLKIFSGSDSNIKRYHQTAYSKQNPNRGYFSFSFGSGGYGSGSGYGYGSRSGSRSRSYS